MRDDYVAGEIENDSDREAVRQGCYYDQEAAAKICLFAETFFTIREGHLAGTRLNLIPYQRYCLSQIFGWKNKTGKRRFKRIYITCGAGSGKNVLIDIIGLYCLLLDKEPAAYVVSAAMSRKQAGIVWRGMNHQISRWPDPYKMDIVRSESKYSIKHGPSGAEFWALPADDGETVFSESVSCAIVNELSYWKKPDLLNALRSRFRSRTQPLLIIITTAGFDRTNESYKILQNVRSILNSEIVDIEEWGFIAEGAEGCKLDDWKEIEKANPAIDVAVKRDYLAGLAHSAKFSKSKEMVFRQQHLNNWVGRTTRFLDLDRWDMCKVRPEDWPTFPVGTEIYLGCDLASKLDLIALVGLVPYLGRIYVLPWAWVPDAAAKKQNNSRYLEFAKSVSKATGDPELEIVPGNCHDQRLIRTKIHQIKQRFKIKKIIIENHEAGLITQDLLNDRFDVHTPPPGYNTYSEALKAMEGYVLDRKFAFAGEEILRWSVQNLQVKSNYRQQLMPDKQTTKEKIDICCALALALTQLLLIDPDRPPERSILDLPLDKIRLYV